MKTQLYLHVCESSNILACWRVLKPLAHWELPNCFQTFDKNNNSYLMHWGIATEFSPSQIRADKRTICLKLKVWAQETDIFKDDRYMRRIPEQAGRAELDCVALLGDWDRVASSEVRRKEPNIQIGAHLHAQRCAYMYKLYDLSHRFGFKTNCMENWDDFSTGKMFAMQSWGSELKSTELL